MAKSSPRYRMHARAGAIRFLKERGVKLGRGENNVSLAAKVSEEMGDPPLGTRGAATVYLVESYKAGKFPVAPASAMPSQSYRSRRARSLIFFKSDAWLSARYQILCKYGPICMLCGSKQKPMHVDHIKPRSLFPELALDPGNLQVLCEDCNLGKSNRDDTDFRPE